MIKILLTLLVSMLTFCSVFSTQVYASDCVFSDGDISEEFKNCAPGIGVKPTSDIDLTVTDGGSDFREITSTIISRVQIVTAVIAIGVIVWIGLILVLPVSAESKESAKSKVVSVVFGFLLMITATIVVNGLINLLYEVFQ